MKLYIQSRVAELIKLIAVLKTIYFIVKKRAAELGCRIKEKLYIQRKVVKLIAVLEKDLYDKHLKINVNLGSRIKKKNTQRRVGTIFMSY